MHIGKWTIDRKKMIIGVIVFLVILFLGINIYLIYNFLSKTSSSSSTAKPSSTSSSVTPKIENPDDFYQVENK